MIIALYNYLSEHPKIGALASISSSALSFLQIVEPFFRFAGIAIGLGIGILTFYIKWKEARKVSKDDK